MPIGLFAEVLGHPVVAVEVDGQRVAHALAHGRGRRPAHVADHPPRQAVAVLVVDDVGVEVAIARRRGGVPEIHLHPRPLAVRRGREVGVFGSPPVLRLGVQRVAADPAPAEVVRLEVAGRLVEPVAGQPVVQQIGQVEQVRDRRLLVGRRGRRGRAIPGEVEVPSPVCRGTPVDVGQVVVVPVEIRVHVVADGRVRGHPAVR